MRHLYIAGTDRWSDYERGTLQIQQVLTYQIDNCSFSIRGNKPTQGEEVIIEDDLLGRLFAGTIIKVDLAKDSPKGMSKLWKVDCDDYTNEIDKKLVVETYQNLTADTIFKDIVAKYCPGFTTNGVANGAPVVEELIFDYVRPSDAFKQLCDYVGWQWQGDYYKDLQFFNPEELNQSAPMALVPGGYFRNLKHTIDQQGIRNRVYVRGGTMLSDVFPYQIVADGVARIWTLPHKPHEITLNLGAVGIENVDKETDFPYLMNFEEKYVRCSAQTSTPAQGTTLSWTYKYDIDVITTVEDIASQQAIAAVQGGGDGVYEHVISDDSLTTLDAAEAAGNADLREYANPKVSGAFDTNFYIKPKYATWRDLANNATWGDLLLDGTTWGDLVLSKIWAPGQLVTIDLPDRGINGTFLIQKLTITPEIEGYWSFRIEYGGRLLGIADFLKALVSSQQKKKLNETALLHKFSYGQEKATVTDDIITTFRANAPVMCGDSDAICGFVQCG